MTDSPEDRKRRLQRRLLVAAWIAGAVFVLTAAGSIVFCVQQPIRVARAIAAIRNRGEPVMPEEIVIPPRAGASHFAENVAAFRAASEHIKVDLLSVGDVDAALAASASANADTESIAALWELRTCLDAEQKASGDQDPVELTPLTASIADGIEPSDCQRLAHRTRRLCIEPAIGAASRLCLGDPQDFAALVGEFARADPVTEAYPDGRAISARVAVTLLVGSAVDLALEDRTEDAVSRLRAALQGVRTIECGPWLAGLVMWEQSEREALVGLRAILQRIPSGIDLHDLETDLDSRKPRLYLIQALQGERAFMNRVYARLCSGFGEPEHPRSTWRTLARLPYTTLRLRDQAAYLDMMQRVIEGMNSPYWTWNEQENRNPELSPPNRSTPLSSAFGLIMPGLIERSAQLEAEILLARAALVAYREGPDAGVRAASSSTDPYSGQPLHSRIDPDGTLVLWSVGRNLVDDGGVSGYPAEDIVWRIPKR